MIIVPFAASFFSATHKIFIKKLLASEKKLFEEGNLQPRDFIEAEKSVSLVNKILFWQ